MTRGWRNCRRVLVFGSTENLGQFLHPPPSHKFCTLRKLKRVALNRVQSELTKSSFGLLWGAASVRNSPYENKISRGLTQVLTYRFTGTDSKKRKKSPLHFFIVINIIFKFTFVFAI